VSATHVPDFVPDRLSLAARPATEAMTEERHDGDGVHVNWRLLGGMVVLLGVAAVAWSLGLLSDGLGHREVPPFLQIPELLSAGGIDEQRDDLTADLAFELTENGTTLRTFAWEESEGNWTLVFYRRGDRGFARFGSIGNPTGFDPPRVVGSPPELRVRDRGTGADMVFHVVDGDVSMVPIDPGVEMIELDPG